MKTRSKCMINPDTAESNIWQNYHRHHPKTNLEQWNRQFLSPNHQFLVTSTSSISEFFDWKEPPGLPGSQRHSFKRSSELCRRKGNEAPPWPSNNGAPIAGGWPKAVGAVGPPLLETKVVHLFLERKSRVWQVLFFKSLVVLFVYSPVSRLCQCSPLTSFLKEIRTWRDQNFEHDPLASVRASSWWLSYSKHCEEVHCLNQSPWKFTSLITPQFRQPYIKRRIVHKDYMKCQFLQIHQIVCSIFGKHHHLNPNI